MSYPFAMEAALKLKEIAYIFSQCYPAGELKHGPLALVDAQTPIFVFSYDDPIIYQKLLSNTQEAKARGGHIVVFALKGKMNCVKWQTVYLYFHGRNHYWGLDYDGCHAILGLCYCDSFGSASR